MESVLVMVWHANPHDLLILPGRVGLEAPPINRDSSKSNVDFFTFEGLGSPGRL